MSNTIAASSHRGSKIVEQHIPCPSCTSSDAYCTYDDGHGYCFSCNYLYLPNHKKEFELSDYTYEYLPWRGVSKETMKLYDAKTKVDANGKPVALGFKYPNSSYKVRLLEEKVFRTTGNITEGGLYGTDKFDPGVSKYITVTEGELDALSIHEALGYPAVSVQSSVTAARDCITSRTFLNSFERIYLAFDGDERGRHAVHQVAKLFDPNKVFVVKFSTRKDANAYVEAGEGVELKRIWWNAKHYLPDKVVSDLEDFEKVLNEPKKIGVPYPFEILNEMTNGIRTGETVLITAQEKVGKTELMHFIEHQLLTRTDDNVAAFFLEEPVQRHLQALAGIHLHYPCHLPGKDIPSKDITQALREVIKKDGRLFVYSHFGNDNGDTFLDTIRFLATARKCRYILFDHISMVVSGILGSAKGSEREYIDYLATKLEMMVKELDIALIMVSHVNDFGQTRGSRWLTKVCDVQINATRDMMSDDPLVRSTINLSIPISRYPGITGNAGGIIFDRETYSFKEQPANDQTIGVEPNRRAA